MSEVNVVYDLADPKTGRTYREDNLAREHRIPVGTLVEVKFDRWFGDGACWKVHARLWVVKHTRDCDGTPLYSLNRYREPSASASFYSHHGFAEDSLVIMDVTPEMIMGEGALEWERVPFGRDAHNLAWWPRFEEHLKNLDVPARVTGTLSRAGCPTKRWGVVEVTCVPNEIFVDDRGFGITFATFVDRAQDPAWQARFLAVRQFGDRSYEQLRGQAWYWKLTSRAL